MLGKYLIFLLIAASSFVKKIKIKELLGRQHNNEKNKRWVQPQRYAIRDPGAWLSTLGSQLNHPSPQLCMPHHMTGGVLNTPHKLCPALISLVFSHTFFDLAQFCKKPCNLVFNVLHELFKRSEDQSIRMFFITNDLQTSCIKAQVLIPGPPLQELWR